MTVDELTRAVISRIDTARMTELREKHAGHWDAKFFDVPTYARRGAVKCEELGLIGAPPRRVFDIGCGFGYFCKAAQCCNHIPFGVDVPSPCLCDVWSCWDNLIAMQQTVMAGEPIRLELCGHPLAIGPFDLITIMGVNFDYPRSWWGPEEYQFLVDDLCAHLAPGGVIHIEHNHGEETKLLETMQFKQPFTRRANVIRITNG